jgi:hypothetical protein
MLFLHVGWAVEPGDNYTKNSTGSLISSIYADKLRVA